MLKVVLGSNFPHMIRLLRLIFCGVLLFSWSDFGVAQESTGPSLARPQEGLRSNPSRLHVLKGATVVVSPSSTIENGVVLVRNGVIESVGLGVDVPDAARVWNMEGKTIYAGFIESLGNQSVGEEKSDDKDRARHWNARVHPEWRAVDLLEKKKDRFKQLRELGFTAMHAVPGKGIFRGQGAVVNLGEAENNGVVLSEDATQNVSFELAGRSEGYPSSLMGCIALIRQTLGDAQWYRDAHAAYEKSPSGTERPEENAALASLLPVLAKEQPVVFSTRDELDYNRALRIAAEFGLKSHFVGNGTEYRVAELLKESGATVILPLVFPKAPKTDTPARALGVSLEQLQHWEFAPSNPAFLEREKVPFALTTHRLPDAPKVFWKHVRKAVERGLSEEKALEALTVAPARLVGMEDRLGTIEKGKIANFAVFNSSPFQDKKAKLHQVWVDGTCFKMPVEHQTDPTGKWHFAWSKVDGPERADIVGEWPNYTLKVKDFELGKIKMSGREMILHPNAEKFGLKAEGAPPRFAAYVGGDRLTGIAQLGEENTFSWTARRFSKEVNLGSKKADAEKGEKEEETPKPVPPLVAKPYPAGAHPGMDKAPPKSLLVRGATVWTCGPDGVLENADLLIEDGKIVEVGSGLSQNGRAVVIDGTGKHVTPGLIDCHSHTAISRGVNEGTHSVTVEVRIGDSLDPTDINIYRQLAGGLTTANLLHGSANPMGGQNQVIKLRWGTDAEGLKFEGAKPGVKFALGENVKQSNWGAKYNTRYPQTRMGVEQIMRDTFLAAGEYETARKKAEEGKQPFRRDLRLEAALEILRGERIVHIHSYRQDEILMFVRLAQEFGFTVGTFQHVLEGYKVADAIAEINAGGSTFSDWWAYKFEVYDAIPYNGSIMHDAGVITSFNSDDSELARRMNTEAAKAVKYGGIPEAEALKFVTLNPAKQLRIDDRVGSLEKGKDADFVIWNNHPLSSYARAEQTWIDGRLYFDLATDLEQRDTVVSERDRLLQLAFESTDSSSGKKKGEDKKKDEPGFRERLFSEWWRYKEIEYQDIYHSGRSLHMCTGAICDHR